MRLWSKAELLEAGDYTIRLEQDVAGNVVDPVERYFEITGPQFGLAGTEIHSVFPPHNAQGSFSSRLPHIALKRRTLPWERGQDSGGPWLALVVLADFEAEFKRAQPIRDAFTTAAAADAVGAPSEGTCDHIVVTQDVVTKVFPALEELPLLTHIREVNLLDTDNAGSDPDGWMSVVIANRLPQENTTYGAYLISLEGQFDELPDPGTAVTLLGNNTVYQELAAEVGAILSDRQTFRARRIDRSTTGMNRQAQLVVAELDRQATFDSTGVSGTSGWAASSTVGGTRINRDQVSTGRFFQYNSVDMDLIDPGSRKLRFPVLAHWTFTTEGAADFQALMTCIDVGMLGTQPDPDTPRPAGCPPAFVIPDEVGVLDSGHTLIERQTRRGETTRAWYRGPFTPREIARRHDAPPFFVADQALAIGEDGRSDLSEAAAFEIGRLLALSDPAFVRELIAWRRSGFAVARVTVVGGTYGTQIAQLILDNTVSTKRILEFHHLEGLSISNNTGPVLDAIDHGDLLDPERDIELLAGGLDLDRAVASRALNPGLGFVSSDPTRGADLTAGFDAVVAQGAAGLTGIRTRLLASDRDARIQLDQGSDR